TVAGRHRGRVQRRHRAAHHLHGRAGAAGGGAQRCRDRASRPGGSGRERPRMGAARGPGAHTRMGCLAVIAVPVVPAVAHAGGRLVLGGLVCAVAAMTAAPAAWATSALDPVYDGSPLDASAGPSGIFDLVAPAVAAASRERLEGVPGGGAAIAMGPPTPRQR